MGASSQISARSKARMEKSGMGRPNRCLLILGFVVFWWVIFFFNFLSIATPSEDGASSSRSIHIPFFSSRREPLKSSYPSPGKLSPSPVRRVEFTPLNEHLWKPLKMFGARDDRCAGRYVYVHRLPRDLNEGMLDDCQHLSLWTNMCKFTGNAGLGPPLEDKDNAFSDRGWYATNQFAVEVIFHNRMKQYDCLTNDSSIAAAIFVPYYAGLDISRYLWGVNVSTRDSGALRMVDWLVRQPEWRRMGGRDHFMVAGRITWDFRRKTEKEDDWGNKLFIIPEVKNITSLVIEASPWHFNDFAIPYPTYFHPTQDSDVVDWQVRMRGMERPALFSFAGAPRQQLRKSIRERIMDQCRESPQCKLLECDFGESKCHVPSAVMKLFEESVFCLQPQGDSFTRRSIFDSMLAGCIPVFFHPDSAYSQFVWHLPRNHRKYSVFISEIDIRRGNVSIESVLRQIPADEVLRMREEVIQLIPRLLYADPRQRLESMQDAFDVAVEAVIDKNANLRTTLLQGKDDDELRKLHKPEGAETDELDGSEESIRRWQSQAGRKK
ncbi:xyloglucan galactosyltransferase MUR3 [Selaginella moellendorffii]|nr:xyloglucan galactosyltransferase MUR3 [Selaginella moellendorffii]XP_024519964.1 xyloglucan galactosyltransferase MUR3 [Selaginella moellendorffii]|eukprot:XP_002990407.2 xyloglucan galactosyltransferase MUR3 [Selaginella moellendorffii]